MHLEPTAASAVAAALLILGVQLVWRGLRGGRDGQRALFRQQIPMVNRIAGFRLTVFGLVLVGVGAAIFWREEWLLWLALGIGFVEIVESSTLIAEWKRGRRTGASRIEKGGGAPRAPRLLLSEPNVGNEPSYTPDAPLSTPPWTSPRQAPVA